MFKEKELIEKTQGFFPESDINLLKLLCEDIDKYNEFQKPFLRLFIDFCTEDCDGEWNPYHTFSIRYEQNESESIVSELSLKEIDNVCCAICSNVEFEDEFQKELNEKLESENNRQLEKIKECQNQGKILFYNSIGEIDIQKLSEFTSQPLSGQLYDINRLKEIIINYKDSDWSKNTRRWINDLALIQLLEFYYDRCKNLESQISQKDDMIITNSIINEK